MPSLSPNQQCQSTEGKWWPSSNKSYKKITLQTIIRKQTSYAKMQTTVYSQFYGSWSVCLRGVGCAVCVGRQWVRSVRWWRSARSRRSWSPLVSHSALLQLLVVVLLMVSQPASRSPVSRRSTSTTPLRLSSSDAGPYSHYSSPSQLCGLLSRQARPRMVQRYWRCHGPPLLSDRPHHFGRISVGGFQCACNAVHSFGRTSTISGQINCVENIEMIFACTSAVLGSKTDAN